MKMTHVTIQTAYFEEEISFYENYAGLTVQGDLRPMGKPIVFLAQSGEDMKIEIIKKPDAADSGNGNLSIGFAAGDIKMLREKMLSDGMMPGPVISPMPGVQFFFVKDPAGVNVQFMQA